MSLFVFVGLEGRFLILAPSTSSPFWLLLVLEIFSFISDDPIFLILLGRRAVSRQVWSTTQFYSVGFLQSKISKKVCVFN